MTGLEPATVELIRPMLYRLSFTMLIYNIKSISYVVVYIQVKF